VHWVCAVSVKFMAKVMDMGKNLSSFLLFMTKSWIVILHKSPVVSGKRSTTVVSWVISDPVFGSKVDLLQDNSNSGSVSSEKVVAGTEQSTSCSVAFIRHSPQ